VLPNKLNIAAASHSNDLLRNHYVLMRQTDSSQQVVSGAMDFGRSWKEENVSQKWILVCFTAG
jgi:hypothetical protein